MRVRTQDGSKLVLIGDISITDRKIVGGQNTIRYPIWNNKTCKLGEYETKERALEVLDELQKACDDYDVTMYEYYPPERIEYIYRKCSSYTMPKE
jgi:hypothetical protein